MAATSNSLQRTEMEPPSTSRLLIQPSRPLHHCPVCQVAALRLDLAGSLGGRRTSSVGGPNIAATQPQSSVVHTAPAR